jgi:hypothetical protein
MKYRVRIATFTNLSFDIVPSTRESHNEDASVRKRANPLVEPTVCVSPLVCRSCFANPIYETTDYQQQRYMVLTWSKERDHIFEVIWSGRSGQTRILDV